MYILINKPKGITSHDVVNRVRNIAGERKVGHSGTLDPSAHGLLILGIGKESTKNLYQFLKMKKTYQAQICLGIETTTDDSEGNIITKSKGVLTPGINEIKTVLDSFKGMQKQIPPAYSAIKVKGKKAYELARMGKILNLKPRNIKVYSIKFISYKYPLLNIESEVSSGTYIRALARDIGKKLGCGAYLMNLKRTKIGKYSIDDSISLPLLNKDNINRFKIQ